MLSPNTKLRLVHAVTSQAVADQIEKILAVNTTPADVAAANALAFRLKSVMNDEVQQRLFNALAGDGNGKAGKELSRKVNGAKNVLSAFGDGNESEQANATATFATTTPIILTDAPGLGNDGAARNGNTITLNVNPPAPSGVILLTVNNGVGPNYPAFTINITPATIADETVSLTTAEFVEFINTRAVTGKSVSFNPSLIARITQQTATGGGPEVLADGGEGDGLVATFSGGASAADTDTAPAQASMGMEKLSKEDMFSLTHALGDEAAAKEFEAAYNAMIDAIQAI